MYGKLYSKLLAQVQASSKYLKEYKDYKHLLLM